MDIRELEPRFTVKKGKVSATAVCRSCDDGREAPVSAEFIPGTGRVRCTECHLTVPLGTSPEGDALLNRAWRRSTR